MRVILILLLLSSFYSLFSQNNFAKELNQIIKDSANHFSKFKGVFKEMRDNDSIYYSKIALEGTSENDIMITQTMSLYRSEIIDSVNEKYGKKIVDQWCQKIISVLGGRFKPEKLKIESWNPVKYGCGFKNGNTWIDIGLFPISINSSQYWVSLAVTQVSEDFYKLK